MTSFIIAYFHKGPNKRSPNEVPLRVRASTCEFGGDTVQPITAVKISCAML